jgi:microcystin-dependent protein
MATPYIGEIRLFPFNFAPRGYAFCAGQILSISQNTALFSILGTTYGGNGLSNFALPDLRDNVPLGQGQSPGLSNYVLGEVGGSTTVPLLTNNMPVHNHQAIGTNNPANEPSPVGHAWAADGAGITMQFATIASPPPQSISPGALGNTGGGQPHTNLQPYLALNYCIALQGAYPARN